MKKSILIALVALAIPASAASINWSMSTGGSANYMVDESGNKLTGVAYLLLADELTSFASEDEIKNVALGFAELTDGINKDTQTATSSKLVAPTAYDFSILIVDSATSSYYVGNATKNNMAYNAGADLDNYGSVTSISFTAKELYATSALRGTQTWTAVGVPEPSSAMLGLLGLGLLLKRRKA